MCAISRGFPPLMRIPFCAATPVPTITAVGVAKPKEQGHAMLSTVIEVWNANRSISSAFVTSLFWFCKRGGKKQQRDACLLIVEDNTHAQSYSFQKKTQKKTKKQKTHIYPETSRIGKQSIIVTVMVEKHQYYELFMAVFCGFLAAQAHICFRTFCWTPLAELLLTLTLTLLSGSWMIV